MIHGLCWQPTGTVAPPFGGDGLKLWPGEGNWTAQQGRVEPPVVPAGITSVAAGHCDTK